MKTLSIRKTICGLTAAVMTAICLPAVAPVNAADQRISGVIGDNCYEMWNQDGDGEVTMDPGNDSFTCSWKDISNFSANMGKSFDSENKSHTDIGYIVVDYEAEYTLQDISYLCVYGWTKKPLVEYFVVEGWGSWRPPGNDADKRGEITVDGNNYDIYKTMCYNRPSLDGPATFPQYWSVRRENGCINNATNYMKGTVSLSEHFYVWSRAGFDMSGTLYNVLLDIDAYRSSGSAVVKNITIKCYTDREKTQEIEIAPDAYGNYFKESFEHGRGDWWGAGSAEVRRNTDNYYDGSTSLFVTGRDYEWCGCGMGLDPEVFVRGKTYSFSAAVLQKSGKTVPMQIAMFQTDGTYSVVAKENVESGVWTKLENTEFTIPEGSGEIELLINTPDDAGDLSGADGLCDFYVDVIKGSKAGVKSSVITGQGSTYETRVTTTTAAPTTTTATTTYDPELKATMKGDTNCDGEVDMSDAVLIMQALANPDKYSETGTAVNHITIQGRINGDLNRDGLTVKDAQAIQRLLLGLDETSLSIDDSAVAGKIYKYEKDGEGGSFIISFGENGEFAYSQGSLDDCITMGTWKISGDTVILTESAETINHMKIKGSDLIFAGENSDNFYYVNVKDGEKFSVWAYNAVDVYSDYPEFNRSALELPEQYKSAVITGTDELKVYLDRIYREEVISKYLEIYDDSFFEKNVLFMDTVFHSPGLDVDYSLFPLNSPEGGMDIIAVEFNKKPNGEDDTLYLLQVSVPKEDYNGQDVKWK